MALPAFGLEEVRKHHALLNVLPLSKLAHL
ncbi:uncharacterized protein G2W53_041035 [Senna tora]|uniref:Uncharacterized protein n=1 Tax=Senna tora TaxID=362788 RepID=A0A834SEJ7_9FABA|nr:uncharacterized protein G2W53_041035 [Senna tora]